MRNISTIIQELKASFDEIDIRLRIIPFTPSSGFFKTGLITIDVVSDSKGEFFEALTSKETIYKMSVTAVNDVENCLVLSVGESVEFLCGKLNGKLFVKDISDTAGKKKPDTKNLSNEEYSALEGSEESGRKVTEKHEAGANFFSGLFMRGNSGASTFGI